MDLKELDKLSSEELAAQKEALLATLATEDPTVLAASILETADFLVKRREQWEAEQAEALRTKLAQIENMGYAELKANAADLIAAAAKEPVEDLASRYVQARTDAKLRDERMAEMGAEIAALTTQLNAAVEAGEVLAEKLAAAEAKIAELKKQPVSDSGQQQPE